MYYDKNTKPTEIYNIINNTAIGIIIIIIKNIVTRENIDTINIKNIIYVCDRGTVIVAAVIINNNMEY